MSHDLSHSHSQLLGFQMNPSSYLLLSNNSLHSHYSICVVPLVLEIRLNTLTYMFLTTSGTHNLVYGSLILLQLPLHLFTLIL